MSQHHCEPLLSELWSLSDIGSSDCCRGQSLGGVTVWVGDRMG